MGIDKESGSAPPTTTASTPATRIRCDLLRLDGGTQSRELINQKIVDEYRNAMESGATFPPVVAFFDGTHHWLADGFHRVFAAARVNQDEIAVDIRQGTLEEAIWYACAANAAHGLRRSNADKRRAVEMALRSPKSSGLSDRLIAEHVAVSHNFVGDVRRALQVSSDDSSPRTGKDGRARSTSSAKRSEAAKARVERERPEAPPPPAAQSPSSEELGAPLEVVVPPAPTSPAEQPAPLALSLFEPPSQPASGARRKMPLRRVLGAALVLSVDEQRVLCHEVRWRMEVDAPGTDTSAAGAELVAEQGSPRASNVRFFRRVVATHAAPLLAAGWVECGATPFGLDEMALLLEATDGAVVENAGSGDASRRPLLDGGVLPPSLFDAEPAELHRRLLLLAPEMTEAAAAEIVRQVVALRRALVEASTASEPRSRRRRKGERSTPSGDRGQSA